jgi:hypothetical protein
MVDFRIDVDPFNGVVDGVEDGLEDLDSRRRSVGEAADDLLGAARDADLAAALQALKDEALTVLMTDSAFGITEAIRAGREARDAYQEFDATLVADTPDGAAG